MVPQSQFTKYQNSISYVANIRLPTEKAHGIQIMKMCEQFAERACLELIVPRRSSHLQESPFTYYKISRKFKITYLPVLDFVRWGRIGFLIESLTFSFSALGYLIFKKTDIIYGRDEIPLCFLSVFKKNIFWEVHRGNINLAVKILIKKAMGVIAISNGLKKFFSRYREDIFVSSDAVDFGSFNIILSKEECRKKLDIPLYKEVVLYSGHLYPWKGADLLAQSSDRIYAEVYLIGGVEDDVARFRKEYSYKNLHILGHRPPEEIPLWLKAADILVLPNSGREDISAKYTSPLKLFEYMASGTPIVAVELPSVKEIISGEEALFFRPDDTNDLVEKIKYVFENYALMKSKANLAKHKSQSYTWETRVENIFSFIYQNLDTKKVSDFWSALVIGASIAVLSIPILQNIFRNSDFFFLGQSLTIFILIFWLVTVSIIAVSGIYIAKVIGRKKPVAFQVVKYGLIGWLNLFLYAGIFNFLSWTSGVTGGVIADLFLLVAFLATTVNGFFWNKFWTFNSDNGEKQKEYINFFLVTSITSTLRILLFHLIVNTIGAPVGISGEVWANIAIFGLVPVSLIGNFLGYRFFVFKRKM